MPTTFTQDLEIGKLASSDPYLYSNIWIDEYYVYSGSDITEDSNEVSLYYYFTLVDARYDCGYAGVAVNRVLNLDHLEGQTVSILANGTVLDQQVVTNGRIELGDSYNVVHVGLPFVADLETLPIEVPGKEGTMQSKAVRTDGVIFKLIQSRGGYIGMDEDNLWDAFTRTAIIQSSGVDLESTELFTGDIRQPLVGEYRRGGTAFYRQVDPLPVTVGFIVSEATVGGGVR